jgi:hypothetical protein
MIIESFFYICIVKNTTFGCCVFYCVSFLLFQPFFKSIVFSIIQIIANIILTPAFPLYTLEELKWDKTH